MQVTRQDTHFAMQGHPRRAGLYARLRSRPTVLLNATRKKDVSMQVLSKWRLVIWKATVEHARMYATSLDKTYVSIRVTRQHRKVLWQGTGHTNVCMGSDKTGRSRNGWRENKHFSMRAHGTSTVLSLLLHAHLYAVTRKSRTFR
jgi:hypothetical protein